MKTSWRCLALFRLICFTVTELMQFVQRVLREMRFQVGGKAVNRQVFFMKNWRLWAVSTSKSALALFCLGVFFPSVLAAQGEPPQRYVPLPFSPPSPVRAGAVQTSAPNPALSSPLSTSTWTALGPAPIVNGQRPGGGPVSGRITGIAAHPADPNTFYVAAAGGGVWKTINGGTSWTPLTDFQSTVSMGAIAIAPSNPLVLYAGTGEANYSGDSNFGRGVLVSTDGGNTWTLRNNGGIFDRKTISEIAIDPTNSNVVYVAIAGGGMNGLSGNTGIWKTTDGGITWTNTTSAITSGQPWSSIRIDPTNPGILYAAVSFFQSGVYKSTNGGISWSLLPGAPSGTAAGRIVVAVGKSNPQVVYVSASSNTTGSLYKFMRSDDGGSTFTDLTATMWDYMNGQGWYDTALIVDPTNSAMVYAAGSSSVLRSVTSGVTWADISSLSGGPHVDHHAAAFDANGKYLDGGDGGVYRLEDPTTFTWTQLNGNLNTIQFQGLGLHPADPNIVLAGSQDNGTSKYSGSVGWILVEGGDGGLVKFSQTNPTRVYHQAPVESFGASNFFRRSDDGGTTWVSKTLGMTGAPQSFYAPFAVDPGNGDRVLYGGMQVWESTNGGDTWSALGAAFPSVVQAIGLSASDFNTIYVSAGNLFVTHNHGATWDRQDLPIFASVADIQVDPANPLTAYAAVRGFTVGGNVFRTTNGGVTWTNISNGLPGIPAWSLQIDSASPGTLYLGTDAGVYRTTDSGATWSRFRTGLPNAQVFQIELNGKLRILGAATHGRGVWEISVNAPPTVASPASATPSPVTATTTNLRVLGADDAGEANLVYTWATTGTPPAPVTFSANGTNADKTVVAMFTKAGNYSFQVTIKDQGGLTVASSVNVTVSQTVSNLTVAPTTATAVTGGTQQFTPTALDQFKMAMAPPPSFEWTAFGGGTIGATGLFTAGNTPGGPFPISVVAGGGLAVATVTVVAPAVVAYVQGASITSDSSASSIARAFTTSNTVGNLIVAAVSWANNAGVTCSDSQGNSYAVATMQTDSQYNQSLAICYAANVKGGANTVTVTFSGAPLYRRLLIQEYQGIAPVNPVDAVAKNVANGTTATNGITSTSAVTTSSGDLIFGAVIDDFDYTSITEGTGFTQRQANNKDMATEDLVQAASGSIAATQTFGATHRYLAQMVAFKASGSVNAPPTVATPASPTPNPVTATTTNLSVLGADDGGEPNLIYTWATTGTPPAPVTFSANGSNAGKNIVATFTKAGNYSFQVTIKDQGGLTVTSSVNVTVNQTLSSLTVAPTTATIVIRGTQQFTPTALDQFKAALAPPPSFQWTAFGGGTINKDGLFTAGDRPGGPFPISVVAGGGLAVATVTVVAPAVVDYVQGASITSDSGASSIARTFTTSNTAGNLIVAAVSWANNAGVTCSDSQGNSYAVATMQTDSLYNQSLAICYAANVKGGANTVTATFSGAPAYRRLLIQEYQGIALVNPVDAVAKNVANGTTATNAITSTSAVTTSSGDLIFGVVMDDFDVISITAGTGFTQRQANNKDMATEDFVQAASSSIAATQTFGAAHRYLAQMVAFKQK